MKNEQELREVIREQILEEGFLDWIRRLVTPHGKDIKAIHNAQQVVEEVYDSLAEFYESHPRRVAQIRRHLESALDAMDSLVVSIEHPRKRD